MVNKFIVTQLFRLTNGGTGASIETKPEEKIDVLKIDMEEKSKEGLWDFFHKDWENKKVATVEFEGYYSDGITPINPIIKHIEYL